jgi:hypothetical protein
MSKTAEKLESKAEREEEKRSKIGTDEEETEDTKEKRKWKIVIEEANTEPKEKAWININLNFVGGAIGTLGVCAIFLAVLQ